MVIIEKGAARSPARAVVGDSGLFRNFRKRPLPVLAIERGLAVGADEEVCVAARLLISGALALAPARTRQPGLRGHIRKRLVAVIAIEMIGRRSSAVDSVIEACAVDQKNIFPAVVVVIDKGRGAPRGFEQVSIPVLVAE